MSIPNDLNLTSQTRSSLIELYDTACRDGNLDLIKRLDTVLPRDVQIMCIMHTNGYGKLYCGIRPRDVDFLKYIESKFDDEERKWIVKCGEYGVYRWAHRANSIDLIAHMEKSLSKDEIIEAITNKPSFGEETPLQIAYKYCSYEFIMMVEDKIKDRVSLLDEIKNKNYYIFQAAIGNRNKDPRVLTHVQEILKDDLLNAIKAQNYEAFGLACLLWDEGNEWEQISFFEKILHHEGIIDAIRSNKYSALSLACSNKNIELFKYLQHYLSAEEFIDALDEKMFLVACGRGRIEVLEYLLKYMKKERITNDLYIKGVCESISSHFFFPKETQDIPAIMKFFLEKECCIDYCSQIGWCANPQIFSWVNLKLQELQQRTREWNETNPQTNFDLEESEVHSYLCVLKHLIRRNKNTMSSTDFTGELGTYHTQTRCLIKIPRIQALCEEGYAAELLSHAFYTENKDIAKVLWTEFSEHLHQARAFTDAQFQSIISSFEIIEDDPMMAMDLIQSFLLNECNFEINLDNKTLFLTKIASINQRHQHEHFLNSLTKFMFNAFELEKIDLFNERNWLGRKITYETMYEMYSKNLAEGFKSDESYIRHALDAYLDAKSNNRGESLIETRKKVLEEQLILLKTQKHKYFPHSGFQVINKKEYGTYFTLLSRDWARYVYSLQDDVLIDLFSKNFPIPTAELFAKEVPDFIQSKQSENQKYSSLYDNNEKKNAFEQAALSIQRKFRISQRRKEEVNRVSRLHGFFINAKYEARKDVRLPIGSEWDVTSKNKDWTQAEIDSSSMLYLPQCKMIDLRHKIVQAAIHKKPAFSTVKHITHANVLKSILDNGLCSQRYLRHFYMSYTPAALRNCDIRDGDSNVICLGPNKIDPNADGEIVIEFDLNELIKRKPAAFYKQKDFGYGLETTRVVQLNDKKLFFDHTYCPDLVSMTNNDKKLFFDHTYCAGLVSMTNYIYCAINYNSQKTSIVGLPKYQFISYNLTSIHPILTLNFFRMIDKLYSIGQGAVADEIYHDIDSLSKQQLNQFLLDIETQFTDTAEFNFMGIHQIDFSCVVCITNKTVKYHLNIKNFTSELNNGHLQLLKEAYDKIPELFSSERFIEFLKSEVKHPDFSSCLTEMRSNFNPGFTRGC